MILDKHSKEALRLIDEGKNLFITGKAGTGKTTLLGEVVKRLNEKRSISVVLAPTFDTIHTTSSLFKSLLT